MSVAKRAKLDCSIENLHSVKENQNGAVVVNGCRKEHSDSGPTQESEDEPRSRLSVEENMKLRKTHIGKSCKVHYPSNPIKLSHGKGAYLFGENGEKFLDCINNVTHVGHCHPYVVKAGQEQMAVLNTNSRFLYDIMVTYAERLVATLPPKLSVCFFVCTGSEANDLAMRMARIHSKNYDIITLDGAYHGHSTVLIDISPYKFKALGGEGKKDYVHVVSSPDTYNGKYQGDHNNPELGLKYAQDVKEAIDSMHKDGRKCAAFFCESMQGCGGQIIFPPGYMKKAFEYVREAGGVCIADEVQVGFGRAGKHFWAFESQDVVPDIVTMGKPIGNGHPLSVVVTTPEIAESFAACGISYFNTFGGNPVSCAIGNAVLDVLENENLQQHALEMGNYLLKKFHKLQERHQLIGDVRGMGLFIGLELVRDRKTKEHATTEAGHLVYRAREEHVLISADGPHSNVIKIKPPLVFSYEDADLLVNTIDKCLAQIEDARS